MIIDEGGQPLYLGYSANAWPSESLADVERFLAEIAVPAREAVAPGEPWAVELRAGERLLAELADPAARERLRRALAERGLTLFSLNAFPLGDFQAAVVKEDAYRPDWTDERRLELTRRAIDLLLDFLPPEGSGTVSTLAGTYRPWGDGEEERRAIARRLAAAAGHACRRREETGKTAALCLEPEPDTTLETGMDCAGLLAGWLLTEEALAAFRRAGGGGRAGAEERLREFLAINYDTCHQAVMFEPPGEFLQALEFAGWRLGKVHLASALTLERPAENLELLAGLADPRFMHQAVGRREGGEFYRAPDLPAVLAGGPGPLAGVEQLRLHFHLPLFAELAGPLGTTAAETAQAAALVRERDACRAFAIETYTWSVLPGLAVPALAAAGRDQAGGVAREYEWARARLAPAAPAL